MEFLSIANELNQGRSVCLRTALEGESAGRVTLLPSPVKDGIVTVDGQRFYEEGYSLPQHLVILGAGHVGRATAKLAAFLGLRVTVLDDRPEMLAPEYFPAGTGLLCSDYDKIEPLLPKETVCYLVATAAHTHDLACAKLLLRRPHLYFGMIGSRKKSAMIRGKLLEAGFTEAEADSIHSPVGLKIGAETPEEIAVSIAAELISVIRAAAPVPIEKELSAALLAPDAAGTLVTVIRKEGSSPRGVGAKLLVLRDGTTVGTVGGGIVEYQAIQLARELTEFTTRTFRSGQGEAGKPVCGGTMELMFQPFDNKSQ